MLRVNSDQPTSVVLVDAPIEGDRRVQQAILDSPGRVLVLDVQTARSRPLQQTLDHARAGWLVLRGFAQLRGRAAQLQQVLPTNGRDPLLAGIRACYRNTLQAVRGARALQRVIQEHAPSHFHAHDLTAGLSLALARPGARATRIYDAHELELHRNRKTGLARMLVEHTHEARVMAQATEVRTVSQPIADKLRQLHPESAARCGVRVVHNDLYPHHAVPPAPANSEPALAYVGRGARGRKLERLAAPPAQLGFSVHTWLLTPQDLAQLASSHWQRGADDYEAELLELVRARRSLMWCCLEPSSHSYRLALPNKFFQALAVCMPIVASRGTYLGELVERHGLGALDDGGPLEALASRVRGDAYVQWVANVVELRRRMRDASVAL